MTIVKSTYYTAFIIIFSCLLHASAFAKPQATENQFSPMEKEAS